MNSRHNRSSKGEIAEELFRNGYNCAQAVAVAFCEEINMDEKTAARLSIGFGGGLGRLREVCGTVSGMAFVISAIYGDDGREAVYKKIQAVAKKFEEENKSIVCRELLGLSRKTPANPVPEARTQEYYKKRPCIELIGDACDIIAECSAAKTLA